MIRRTIIAVLALLVAGIILSACSSPVAPDAPTRQRTSGPHRTVPSEGAWR